jgi:hypothetical protein
MDVRDFAAWKREARVMALIRRSENYAASLLPHREAGKVNEEIKKLELTFYEAEHEDEIDEAERDMREYLEKKMKGNRRK